MYFKKLRDKKLLIAIYLLIINNSFAQKVVHYDLHIKDSIVNFSGKFKRAIAVNGQIPMPTLIFTEGDTAEILVYNELKEATSLHWHGLFLPNKEDGVPFLTQMPIKPNSTYLYRFPIVQHGTHWYHSHSDLQEQIGMYGSMILNKKNEYNLIRKGIDDIPTIPIILSEWTNEKPENVHRMLHNATDWFAIKKGSTQSYSEAIKQGYFKIKLQNEWKRMNAMDVSDVFYNTFLINGKNESTINIINDRVRLNVSNGGASTYFWLTYAGGKITVVANDGNDIKPIEVDRLIIAASETYDIILPVPNNNIAYQFLATSEDRTNSTSIFIGQGVKQLVNPMPKLKYFEGMKMMNAMMKMDGNLNDNGMQMSLNKMDMNTVMYPEALQNDSEKKSITTLNYSMLKSTISTNLQLSNKTKILKFELTGNMNRYVWSFNNKVVSEVDKILIEKGERVKIILYNGSMMRHPIHLHGHDFRVLNGQGDYAPLKNTIDIMPMETDTIEFNANAEGNWFFHCHILYHMMAGMGRVLAYKNQIKNNGILNPKIAQRKLFWGDRKPHIMLANDLSTNGNDGMLMLGNTRWQLKSEWRLGYSMMHGYEMETHLGRYLGKMQWLMPFIGFDWRKQTIQMHEHNNILYPPHEIDKNIFGQINTKHNRSVLSVGFDYTLPMLIKFQTEMFVDGIVRLQLMRDDIPISKRVRCSWMLNTDKEYMIGFKYIMFKNVAISTHYDSDMGAGFGVTLNY